MSDPPGDVWVTTPLLQLALDLAEGPIAVREAWTTKEVSQALTPAGERLREARSRLTGSARDAVKAGYVAGTAWLEFGPQVPAPLARPAWRRAVVDRNVANTVRALSRTTPTPFGLTAVDTAFFVLDDPEAVPGGLRVGEGLGAWKPKGNPVPMREALLALSAGGLAGLLAVAEGR